MSRIARNPTISPKLYRQFAMVTLVVTALLAFFASGENREAAAEALVAPVSAAPEPPKIATSQSVAFRAGGKAPRSNDQWGSDGGGDGGDGGGIAGDVEFSPGARRPENAQPPVPMSPAMQLSSLGTLPETAPPGMPKTVFEQLKREQKRLKAAGPQVTSQSDMARMVEQSRQRSGSDEVPIDQTD